MTNEHHHSHHHSRHPHLLHGGGYSHQMRHGILYLLATFCFIAFAIAYLVFTNTGSTMTPPQDTYLPRISIGGTALKVYVADTEALRAKGLSGRTQLPPYHGMLFKFDKPDYYHFWMKDMNFPIDIIWISEDNTVVDITTDAKPDSYNATDPSRSATFSPQEPAKYAVEVVSGFTEQYNIFVGDEVKF